MKKINKNLGHKLSGYAALAALFAAPAAHGQVVYTDVNPDYVVQIVDAAYPLDLDNDGISDFDLSVSYSTSIRVPTHGYYTTTNLLTYVQAIRATWGNVAVNTNDEARALKAGDAIGPALNFNNLGVKIPVWHVDKGWEWKNKEEDYLALRLQIAGKNYYGWARIKVHAYSSSDKNILTVKDYAFNLTPNAPLLAGEMEQTAIQSVTGEASLKLNINNKQLTLLNLPPEYTGGEAKVIDLQGRVIMREPISSTSLQLNLSSSPTGMYFIEVKKGNTSQRQKFVLN